MKKKYGNNVVDLGRTVAVVKNDKGEYDIQYYDGPAFSILITEEQFEELAKDLTK